MSYTDEYEDIGLQLVESCNMQPIEQGSDYLYGCVPIELLHKDFLSPAALRVYIYLMRAANKKGYCYPSQQKMGDILGYSRRIVNRAIKELVDNKIIIKHTIKKSNNEQNNIYATPISVAFKKPKYFSSIKDKKVQDKKDPQVRQKRPAGMTKRLQKEYKERLESSSSKATTTVNLDNIKNLEESKGTNGAAYIKRLLFAWHKLLSTYPLRPADVDNLSKITIDDWLLEHITLWPRFLHETNDEYIRQSDGSLSVLINNLSKFRQFVEHDPIRYITITTSNNSESPVKTAIWSARLFQEYVLDDLDNPDFDSIKLAFNDRYKTVFIGYKLGDDYFIATEDFCKNILKYDYT